MGGLSQSEDNVARLLVWQLVGLASEYDALALSCTARNVQFKDVLGLNDLFALTLFATVLLGNYLACTIAITAGDCFLGHKARADLTKDLLCAWSMVR